MSDVLKALWKGLDLPGGIEEPISWTASSLSPVDVSLDEIHFTLEYFDMIIKVYRVFHSLV